MIRSVASDMDDPRQRGAELREGAVGIIPTDTIYGIVASVHRPDAVERVYELKRRERSKPCIVLCSSYDACTSFPVEWTRDRTRICRGLWPGPVSIVLPCSMCPDHLTRGADTLAFRVPNDEWLCALLACAGPLIAPSANREGEEPARKIEKARTYFGEAVDFYVDNGTLPSKPSTLIDCSKDTFAILRHGAGTAVHDRLCDILSRDEPNGIEDQSI